MTKLINKRSIIILLGILVVLLIISGTAYLEELRAMLDITSAEMPSLNFKSFITKVKL